MKNYQRLLVACGFFMMTLCACQHSPQKHYFVLSAPDNNTATTSKNITTVIGIGPIEIADYLHRPQMIYTQADNTLSVSSNDYWAEPLDKGIAHAIAGNLAAHNNERSFVYFPWRSDSKPHYSLRVIINNLTYKNQNASIAATWELFDNDTKASVERHNFLSTTPAEKGAQALAQAYSKLLADLVAEMDNSLNQLPQK